MWHYRNLGSATLLFCWVPGAFIISSIIWFADRSMIFSLATCFWTAVSMYFVRLDDLEIKIVNGMKHPSSYLTPKFSPLLLISLWYNHTKRYTLIQKSLYSFKEISFIWGRYFCVIKSSLVNINSPKQKASTNRYRFLINSILFWQRPNKIDYSMVVYCLTIEKVSRLFHFCFELVRHLS